MLHTMKYKTGWIHVSIDNNGREIIRVQLNRFPSMRQVKSMHQAKILITKNKPIHAILQ